MFQFNGNFYWGDLTIPEIGLHLDVVIGALDEIGDNKYPSLDLGGDGRVKTALQEKAFVAWLAAAHRVAFGTLTRLAAEKRIHHSPGSGHAAGRQRGRRLCQELDSALWIAVLERSL